MCENRDGWLVAWGFWWVNGFSFFTPLYMCSFSLSLFCNYYRRHVSYVVYLAFASRDFIELDRDINSECNAMFAD